METNNTGLTDNEIIKAFKDCNLENATLYLYNEKEEKVVSIPTIEIFDLINRQKAENENYKQIAENQQSVSMDKEVEIKRLKAENEWLLQKLQQAQAEAVKEFAERLKARKYQSSEWSHGGHPFVVEEDDIDEILEEMVGEDK